MECPLKLDCATMTGLAEDCPNFSECSSLRFLARRRERPPFDYNPDWEARDRIIFGHPQPWENDQVRLRAQICGGCKNFYNLTIAQLQQLLTLRFANPYSHHNLSPMVQEFLRFAQLHAEKGFHCLFEGYAIAPSRSDYRVSIDGIAFEGEPSDELIESFQAFALDADVLKIEPNYLRAWWD